MIPFLIPLLSTIIFRNPPFTQAIRSLSFLSRHSSHSSQLKLCFMNDIQNEKRQFLDQNSAWNIRVTEQYFNDAVLLTKPFAPDRYLGNSTHMLWPLTHTPKRTLFRNIYVVHSLLQILNLFIDASKSQVFNRWPILSFLPLKRSGIYGYPAFEMWWQKRRNQISSFGETESI
jgi:hypothetical protein